jgi:hypothetical protein
MSKEHPDFRISRVGAKTETVVASKDHGKRTVHGTDWPVNSTVAEIKDSQSGKVLGYRVTSFICNGYAERTRDFRTIEAAKQHAGIDV